MTRENIHINCPNCPNSFKSWLEGQENPEVLSEIDWENDFSDVKKVCVDPKQVVDYLNQVLANKSVDYGQRKKFSNALPYVHAKSTFFKKDAEEVDIEHFIKQITAPPKNLINTNEKMLKSGGTNEFVYKTGLPAFRGIAYDIAHENFVYINTCPGAGDCVLICYARKGRYIQYPNSYDSMTRRLNLLLNNPEKYEDQLYKEIKAKCIEHKALEGYKAKVILRWNDSGDFFTQKYVKIAESVKNKLKENGYNVEPYAYTKVAGVAKDAAVGVTSFSSGASKKETDKISKNQKMSQMVPSSLFAGLDLMKISDEQKLKRNIATYFKIPLPNIISYDELKSMPVGETPKWHVIVTPDGGDDPAWRKDVKTTLLTQH